MKLKIKGVKSPFAGIENDQLMAVDMSFPQATQGDEHDQKVSGILDAVENSKSFHQSDYPSGGVGEIKIFNGKAHEVIFDGEFQYYSLVCRNSSGGHMWSIKAFIDAATQSVDMTGIVRNANEQWKIGKQFVGKAYAVVPEAGTFLTMAFSKAPDEDEATLEINYDGETLTITKDDKPTFTAEYDVSCVSYVDGYAMWNNRETFTGPTAEADATAAYNALKARMNDDPTNKTPVLLAGMVKRYYPDPGNTKMLVRNLDDASKPPSNWEHGISSSVEDGDAMVTEFITELDEHLKDPDKGPMVKFEKVQTFNLTSSITPDSVISTAIFNPTIVVSEYFHGS